MRRLLGFLILCNVKIVSWTFFKAQTVWLGTTPTNPWKDLRLIVFLNHTSLYEPLFLQVIPFTYLWHLADHFNVPGADITLNRPIVGTFWKLMVPNISSVTRKKDASWENYLKSISPQDVVMIAAEGRMKRPDGLDKYGKPMTVRGGIADIINALDEGTMLLCFSGGLHHVQAPGQHFPNLFKTININIERLDIKEYKKQFSENPRERKIKMVQDLQERLGKDCPKVTLNK
jgi:1-acyl-sn-glycerol-3-phosphate acyltransferase